MTKEELYKEAEEICSKYFEENCYKKNKWADTYDLVAMWQNGYNKAKEDVKHDLMMKLKDEGIVKVLKDSILCNKKLSSQEQQELCAWIECAMEFGEKLDECAKELEAQIEKMKCCGNCEHFDFNEPNYCYKGMYRGYLSRMGFKIIIKEEKKE